MAATLPCDMAIVGGGLAGGLIALALRQRRPDADMRLIEASPTIGGNHVWSFFSSDVADSDRWLSAPLVSYGWTGYDVSFPAHRRHLDTNYYSIESERFDAVVRARLAPGQLIAEKAIEVSANEVVLANGDRVEARGVIDARGPGEMKMLDLGWQKFLGRELILSEPHDLVRPMVMDSAVEQIDGYRFLYSLPFAATRLFVEDTYYSDAPDLDRAALIARIDAYAATKGWRIDHVAREEHGALPVVMGGDFDQYWDASGPGIAKAGLRAGLFHPTTGYSFPDAIRLAAAIAVARDLSSPSLHALTYGMAKRAWLHRRFYRMLDVMLFRAAEPCERYRLLQRFYQLNPRLIGRFYAGRSTLMDKVRILAGKPPVPLGRAVTAMLGSRR